jgi:threonine/homoserine/homoserine lactone efflux protein
MMPPIVTILVILALFMLVVIKITSAKGSSMTEEQAAKYSKWIRILVPLMLIGVAIKYFMG